MAFRGGGWIGGWFGGWFGGWTGGWIGVSFGLVAHSVERVAVNREVVGSKPTRTVFLLSFV